METKSTNLSLVPILVVLGILMALFSVQAKEGGDDHHGCDQLKETKLSVYFRDYFSGAPNSTDFSVFGFPGKLWRFDQFGTLNVFDDILTEGPELTSAKVGRIHGTSQTVSSDGKNVLLSCSLIFTNHAYNGSTIQIVGLVNQFDYLGEYGVTSGTGKFRYATGYSTWESLVFDLSNFSGLFRVNVTIRHII